MRRLVTFLCFAAVAIVAYFFLSPISSGADFSDTHTASISITIEIPDATAQPEEPTQPDVVEVDDTIAQPEAAPSTAPTPEASTTHTPIVNDSEGMVDSASAPEASQLPAPPIAQQTPPALQPTPPADTSTSAPAPTPPPPTPEPPTSEPEAPEAPSTLNAPLEHKGQ
jgi:hypothetical protein